MPLYLLLILTLAVSGVLFFGYTVAYRLPSLRAHRIHDDPNRKLKGPKLYRRVFANMAFSGGLAFVFSYALYGVLFHDEPTSGLAMLGRGVLILLVYDFLYYWMHRVAFHKWSILRRVHAVHHAVRHPNAFDALYLHPVETFLGLALLILCTWMLGPVHIVTFAWVFGVYSALNIVVHCGLDFRFPPFRVLSYLARKHDVHHTSMKGGNFASITPIWDILFKTAE